MVRNAIKTIIGLTAIALLMSSFTASNHLEWQDWNVALKQAAANKNKIILVDLYTDWCGWCKRMDKDTYENAGVVSLLKQNFIAVKLNPEKGGAVYEFNGKKISSRELTQELANKSGKPVKGYPTTVFYHPGSNKVILVEGYQNAEQFSQTINLVQSEIISKK